MKRKKTRQCPHLDLQADKSTKESAGEAAEEEVKPESDTTLFVKNLSFETNDEALRLVYWDVFLLTVVSEIRVPTTFHKISSRKYPLEMLERS